jgi:ectoine hydroxylase-related dioxygenase (phytanoyl-CoA dioxygenase family)
VSEGEVLLERGWVAVPQVLAPKVAAGLAVGCDAVLAGSAAQLRPRDKAHGGTHHVADLEERLPEVAAAFIDERVIDAVQTFLPGEGSPASVSYRDPQPGFGEQRFHTDAVPLLEPGSWQAVTAIVALCDFREDNGATAVVPGSHLRPDLQRLAGKLEDHPQALVLTGPIGTVFVFSGHLLHRGTRNRSEHPRPALQVLWNR